MGRVKEYFIELQEQEFERHLAKVLGIPYDDLTQLDYDIETINGEEGELYSYAVNFSKENPHLILKKIHKLNKDYTVYVDPWELDNDFDYTEQFEAITQNKDYIDNYQYEINNLRVLASLKISDEILKGILNRQVFISVIGTMETFLSDVFINLTFDDEKYFKNFIETHPEFSKRKFELKSIFQEYSRINETAKKIMLDTIYHNLPIVKEMFENTFKIEFPEIKEVYKYVLLRHDLVHRNGKSKEGKEVATDFESIENLIETVDKLIYELGKKLNLKNACR